MEYFNVVRKAAALSDLSKTDIEILRTLDEKRKLLVAEIAENIERSERHIRQRLHVLIEKGFLKKEIEILKNKRLAYMYSLESTKKIVEETKNRLFKKISELNSLLLDASEET
jgi:predicted transcriptional regulator